MGQNPSPASRQQPILRPLTPRSKASRFAAMAGIGAASALAGAVAVIVYTNAVSNPKVLDASAVPEAEVVSSIIADDADGTEGKVSGKEDNPAAAKAVKPVEVASAGKDAVALESLVPAENTLKPKPVKTITIAAAPAVPAPNDPRWSGEPPIARNMAVEVLREKIAASDTVEQGATAETALALADPGDMASEPAPLPEDTSLAVPEPEPADDRAVKAEPSRKAQPKRTATITTAVNMRASASSKGGVVMVIPAKAEVGLAGCKGWCEIIYRGKRGFVWKDFIRPGSTAKPLNALAGG